METRQLEAQKDAANELERFQQDIESLLAATDKLRMVILIDRVDEVWNQTEEAEMMIISLMKAVHDLNSKLGHAHTMLFLRSDIYNVLKFHDSDKFHSLEERIDWEDNDLKHLITTRGKVSAGLAIQDTDLLWNTLFDKYVNGEPSFVYMLKRTMKRPRELIQFCNSALTEAQDNGHNRIHEQDILEAEKHYSNWKLKDLASEFSVQYPYLEEMIGLFQGFKSEFTHSEFETRYEETKARLASKHPDLQAVSSDKMLQILFIVGLLGMKAKNQRLFVYDDPMILLPQQTNIVVHSAFHLALGLQKTDAHQSGGVNVEFGTVNVGGDIVGRDKVVQTHYAPTVSGNRELESLMRQLNELRRRREEIEQRLAQSSSEKLLPRLQMESEEVSERIVVIQRDIVRIEEYLKSRSDKVDK